MVLMKKLHRIIDERGEKLLPLPSGWHKYGFNRIRNHFNCDGLDADVRPLPTSQDWDFYKKLLGLALSRDPIFKDPYIDGPPPFYPTHGARGRGLFASRDIKIWALVHNGGKSDIIFPHAMTWRWYIFFTEEYGVRRHGLDVDAGWRIVNLHEHSHFDECHELDAQK